MMSQPPTPVLPHASPDSHHQRRPARAPLVERIAGWSARHRNTAVFGWLALVAVVFLAGQAIGASSVPAYDAGPSGQAEQAMHQLGAVAPAVEDVLIQARGPGQTFATDAHMRQAARQLSAALARLPGAAADIRSPLDPGGHGLVSADGRSALVTFAVPGPAASQVTAVAPALSAVAASQARYPALLIAEGGDASYGRTVSSVLDTGFRTAEATSVPVTLVLPRWLAWLPGRQLSAGPPAAVASREHAPARERR